MSKYVKIKWSYYCQKVWETLKQKESTTPVLCGPNWSLPFIISTNSFDISIGGFIGQQEGQNPYSIYCINKNIGHAIFEKCWTHQTHTEGG